MDEPEDNSERSDETSGGTDTGTNVQTDSTTGQDTSANQSDSNGDAGTNSGTDDKKDEKDAASGGAVTNDNNNRPGQGTLEAASSRTGKQEQPGNVGATQPSSTTPTIVKPSSSDTAPTSVIERVERKFHTPKFLRRHKERSQATKTTKDNRK